MDLKPCPCGETPTELNIQDGGQGFKWAFACGNCCGEWWIEFRSHYEPIDSAKCMQYAVEEWNRVPRKKESEGE
jgi:hypothetical protein